MAKLEGPPMAYEETKYPAKVELHNLSEESLIEHKYMGTDADRYDMTVLGRKQVLRVRRKAAAPLNTAKPLCYIVSLELILRPQRNFKFLSTVGFAAVLISTWELLFAYGVQLMMVAL